jgi:Zn-finger nucleic acid-binding protein
MKGHLMKCPNDDTILVMTDRQGIEIDYCPQCRGVWLDRGELDKILDRTSSESQLSPTPPAPQPQYEQRYDERRTEYREQRPYDGNHYKKRKKEGLLGDLFDF